MPKAYWITCYQSITDPAKVAAYAELGAPAIRAAGGKILVRGNPVQVHEAGIQQRTVIVEFESIRQAIAARDSAAYQEALNVLGNGARRDMRIIEGID